MFCKPPIPPPGFIGFIPPFLKLKNIKDKNVNGISILAKPDKKPVISFEPCDFTAKRTPFLRNKSTNVGKSACNKFTECSSPLVSNTVT